MNKTQMIELTSSVIALARAIADASEEERAEFAPEFLKKADEVAAAWKLAANDQPERSDDA